MHWLPKIHSCHFPHYVQGVGKLTPLRIQVSGWGMLQVKALDKSEFAGYKKTLSAKAHVIELNVPKGSRIQVRLWNLFGWSTLWLQTPVNNTPVSAIQQTRPISKHMPSPGTAVPKLMHPILALQTLRTQWQSLRLKARYTGQKLGSKIARLQAQIAVPSALHLNDFQHTTPNFKSRLHKNVLKAPQQNFDHCERKLQ